MGVIIANIKLGYIGASAANIFAVSIANAGLRNNSTSIAITLLISIAGNYLKSVRWIDAYIVSRLGTVRVRKAENKVEIDVIILVYKSWNCRIRVFISLNVT